MGLRVALPMRIAALPMRPQPTFAAHVVAGDQPLELKKLVRDRRSRSQCKSLPVEAAGTGAVVEPRAVVELKVVNVVAGWKEEADAAEEG